jgi:hypothetical protein
MNVLLDACVPRPLRKFLPTDTVRAAREMGWRGMWAATEPDGELVARPTG